MPPQDSCVPSHLILICPTNYTVVVRNALYGVTKIPGVCNYQPGDCIVESTDSIMCLTDSPECSINTTKTKIPQCNNEYSSYFYIEYDCVPISLNDKSKEYNLCSNTTAITSDYGIITSLGYPSPHQTSTEQCIRTIQVPDDKIIRLWLTDLFIPSIGTTCSNDFVYVVDNVQTYKHCGNKRYAYPYLCSSTIIIQYLTRSGISNWRGMRLYFEIIDRPANDSCPKIAVTQVPDTTVTAPTAQPTTTTKTPDYVLLGIASPIRNFQICAGK
jgi:hypothetical protein